MASIAAKPRGNPDKDGGIVESTLAPSPAPDGGWGWMCVLGCALMHFVVVGYHRSYGLIYLQLQYHFDSSAALTASVGGASIALRMCCSPLSNALSRHYSARVVVFVGGLIVGTGSVLSAFATSTEYMIFSHAAMGGIGGSLVYSPSLVVLCEYFDKRRSLAIGIATSGESFGAIVVPHLMVILFDHYGFFGGLLILGAAMYNCCVSGALYRPIALNRQKPMTPSNLKNVSGVVFGSNDKDIPATETDSYAGAVTTSQKSSRLWETASTVGRVLDLAIWTDWRFSLFAASQTLAVTSFLPVLMLAPAVAEDGGMSQEQAASVISAIAAGDLVGHVISGVVFDLPSVRRVRYRPFSACMLVMALAIVWMPFITSIDVMLLCAVVFGFCVGIVIAHRTNILCDLLGTERISTGLGMMVCAQGVGTFVGPLLTGWLRDYFGSFKVPFTILAAVMAFAGVLSQVVNSLAEHGANTTRPSESLPSATSDNLEPGVTREK